jgi:hypothetical protein
LDDFIEVVLGTRFAALQLEWVAEGQTRLPGFPGRKLNGALGGGLKLVAEHPDPQLRFLARSALGPADPPEVRSGIRTRPYVLGVTAGPVRLEAGQPFEAAVGLFGEAAETVPAWVEAARRVVMDYGPTDRHGLQLVRATIATPAGPLDVLSDPPSGPGVPLYLGDLAAPPPPSEAGVAAIDLLTPTQIGVPDEDQESSRTAGSDEFLAAGGTPALFVDSVLRRLRAIARVDLHESAVAELRAVADAIRIVEDRTRLCHVIHGSREHDRAHRFRARVGAFRCAGPVGPLAPLLYLGQFTHVGKLSTWGCGRYSVQFGQR